MNVADEIQHLISVLEQNAGTFLHDSLTEWALTHVDSDYARETVQSVFQDEIAGHPWNAVVPVQTIHIQQRLRAQLPRLTILKAA